MMPFYQYFSKRSFPHWGFAIIVTLWCLVSSGWAQSTNTYHTNRVFNKVTFTIPGVPTAFEVYNMAGQLTTVVGPTNVITNGFYATERQSIVLEYELSAQAWSALLAGYPANSYVHTNRFDDNAGWVKGLLQTWNGNWGGYIWVLQNTVNFKTSPTNVWVSTNGVTNSISKVLVGTIGDYTPMTDQSDTGPSLAGLTNRPTPGDPSNDVKYKADFTAYYELAKLPIVYVQPLLTNVCVNSGNVTFTLGGASRVTNGVTWSISPGGLSNGATWIGYPSNVVVNVGGIATSYVVKATANDNTNIYGSAILNVVKVESIQPDSMTHLQEIDDGDDNPKTRVFVVPIAQAMDFPVVPVTVRAILNPNLSESQVPAGMTLEGGIGSEKLTRTVNRSVAAGPSKTEFTFSYCGSDSGLKTTVYVYDAKVSLFADNGGENSPEVGHSWGRYTLDDDTRRDLIPLAYWTYLREIGFFPTNTADWGQILLGVSVPGDVRLGSFAVGSHWPTGWKEYPILFSSLSLALPQIEAIHSDPPYYNLFSYNCTDVAIGLGEIVNVYTMDTSGVSTPWVFSSWLNSN